MTRAGLWAFALCSAALALADEPRWAGSSISLDHAMSLLSVDRSAEPTWNPSFVQTLGLAPTWKLGDVYSLSGALSVETELTDSDDSTRKHEPLLSDFDVGISRKLPWLRKAFSGRLGLSVGLPTSKESRARERIASIRPLVSLGRSFDVRPGFKLTAGARFTATYLAATARSLTYDAPSITTCRTEGGNCEEFNHSGARSSIAVFQQLFSLQADMPHHLGMQLAVGMVQSMLYPLDDIHNPASGGLVPPSETNTDWRYAMIYVLGAEWAPLAKLSVGVGIQTANPQQAPDSTYYRPFFNRHSQLIGRLTYTF